MRKVTKMQIVNRANHSLKIQEYINGIKLTMQINKNNQNKHSMVILISIGYFFLLVLHLLVHLLILHFSSFILLIYSVNPLC